LSAPCGFVDARGRPIVLRGFNTIAPEAPSVWAKAVSLGANFVRIPVSWSEVEPAAPKPGHRWNARLLSALDRELRYFRRRHVYVLLDFHQFRWSPYFHEEASGIPAWFYEDRDYPHTHAGKQRALADWWTDPDGLRAYSDFVAMIVRRYRSFPNLVGYELFNEPATGRLGENHAATQAVLAWEARVREVVTALDASRTVFVQTRGGGDLGLKHADFSVFGSLDNLAVDLHSYFSGTDGTGYSADGERWVPEYARAHLHDTPVYSGTETNQEALLRVAVEKTRELGVPLLIGEWGARNNDPNADLYQAQMLRIFARHGLSWARWDLGTNPTFGILHPSAVRRGLQAQLRAALAKPPAHSPPTCAASSERGEK
jgi:aryl-phospho-beta-D-glucosidase BglC (GH1 family)